MDSKLQPVQLYGFSKSRLYEPLGTAIFFRNRFCPVSWILLFLPVHFYGYSLFSGESNCADTWMRTMKEGKIGLSLGCRGDRATGALAYGDVRVTMTTEQLLKALDGCDTVEKNNILYPYNPTCLYKSAF